MKDQQARQAKDSKEKRPRKVKLDPINEDVVHETINAPKTKAFHK